MTTLSKEKLEIEAKEAHDRGDYYTWGKIQAELDRLYLVGKVQPISGCNCFSCRGMKGGRA